MIKFVRNLTQLVQKMNFWICSDGYRTQSIRLGLFSIEEELFLSLRLWPRIRATLGVFLNLLDQFFVGNVWLDGFLGYFLGREKGWWFLQGWDFLVLFRRSIGRWIGRGLSGYPSNKSLRFLLWFVGIWSWVCLERGCLQNWLFRKFERFFLGKDFSFSSSFFSFSFFPDCFHR